MTEELTRGDCEFLLESLNYARLRLDETRYPNYQLRQQRIAQVDALAEKLRSLRGRTGN